MKLTTISILAILSCTTFSYGQGLNNLLSPVGKIGVGTIFPKERFHLIGNFRCDSNVIVGRSLSVGYQSTFAKNALFQEGIKVNGLSSLVNTTVTGALNLTRSLQILKI